MQTMAAKYLHLRQPQTSVATKKKIPHSRVLKALTISVNICRCGLNWRWVFAIAEVGSG